MNDSYVQILLPVPLNALFTYRLPAHVSEHAGVGHRVIVPFGPKRFYTGIIQSFVTTPPSDIVIRDVAMVLDDAPIVTAAQLRLWDWISDYYLCAPGDVFKAALPAGLKIESETFVEINPDYVAEPDFKLTERQAIIQQLLDHEGALNIDAIASRTGLKNIQPVVNSMINEGLIIISEKLVERYRPQRVSYVAPTFDSTGIQAAFQAVKGAKKQETLLLALLDLTGVQRPDAPAEPEVDRATLLERSGCTAAIVKALADKGLVKLYNKEINRFAYDGSPTVTLPTLTQPQSTALDEIKQSWNTHAITLLHGVTSSGKTEIYQHLIADVLKQGHQALFLVPEIALTTQLTKRLQNVFGKSVIVYHSKFSDNERVDIYRRLLADKSPAVVIGARSSIFLPFTSLGLVIVDEEHEQSYKQFDPAPRYNARDCAIMLAAMHGAKTLLGSATPSVETYHKATTEKFGLVTLSTRFNEASLPSVTIIDMLRERKAKHTTGTFSLNTLDAARNSLSKGNQIILFQPRRGYSPLARCRQCAWTPRCSKCDVALTYHRDINQLVCHYCGSTTPLPRTCPQCHEPAIETIGYGTERIQDEVSELFPNRRVSRMDLDTTRNKSSYLDIITSFSEHHSDILIGTQMVTKGLDFANVSVVAILNADTLINQPDFRATERAFNTLMQVAGRAGRRTDTPGDVIIQTSEPQNPIFTHIVNHDYTTYYNTEIQQRQQYFYPPFSRIIYVYLKHRQRETIHRVANAYTERLRSIFGNRVYGPEKPPVERINTFYIRKLMLKLEQNTSMKHVKKLLKDVYDQLYQDPNLRGMQLYYDVDPY